MQVLPIVSAAIHGGDVTASLHSMLIEIRYAKDSLSVSGMNLQKPYCHTHCNLEEDQESAPRCKVHKSLHADYDDLCRPKGAVQSAAVTQAFSALLVSSSSPLQKSNCP